MTISGFGPASQGDSMQKALRAFTLAGFVLAACSVDHAPPGAPSSSMSAHSLLRAHSLLPRSAATPARGVSIALADRASAPVRLATGAARTVVLEVTALDVRDVGGADLDGARVFSGATASGDLVQVRDGDRYEELRVVRAPRESELLRYRLHPVAGIAAIRQVDDVVEVVDVAGAVRFVSEPIVAIGADGSRRHARPVLTHDGSDAILGVTVDLRGLQLPIVIDPGWKATIDMLEARSAASGSRLLDGRVLVAGGLSQISGTGQVLSTTEIFDPKTETWVVGPPMAEKRYDQLAVTLKDGRVFVAGNTSAELYDPVANKWSPAAAPPSSTAYATIVLLDSGSVLVLGGSGPLAVSRLYDPTTDSWSLTSPLNFGRSRPVAVRVASGKVFVAGGNSGSPPEIFDPETRTWKTTAPIAALTSRLSMAALADGRVYVLNGDAASTYDPTTDTYTPTTAPPPPVAGSTVARTAYTLDSGEVFVAELHFEKFGSTVRASWVFDPKSATGSAWSDGPPQRSAVVPLSGSKVFVAGGDAVSSGSSTSLKSAKVFTYGPPAKTCTAATECDSGFCVDGYCCDAACTGQCEACDNPARQGECSAVSGDPHGSRTKCPGGTDVCTRRFCDGVTRDACGAPKPGTACGDGPTCDGSFLVSGGVCMAGTCVAGDRRDCAPYRCRDGACPRSCGSNLDCVDGYACLADICQEPAPAGARCSDDRGESIAANGSSVACRPYLCGSDGLCAKTCASNTECAAGFECLSGRCTAPAPSEGSGGCSLAGAPRPALPWPLLLLSLALRRRRRA